jgi:hypothetical protein
MVGLRGTTLAIGDDVQPEHVKFVGAHGVPQINSLRGTSLLVRDSIARLNDASCGAFEIAIA